MTIPSPLSRVHVVLCRPRFGGNIGASARAVKNMGLGGLVLAGAEDFHPSEARMMAAEAGDVLAAAPRHETLAAALAPFDLSFAFTRRVKGGRPRVVAVREAALHLARELGERRAALVFGCEESGLSSEEAALCSGIVAIPSSPGYPSLNLAAAVMVAAYEVRFAFEAAGGDELRREGSPGEREQMFEQVEAALDAAGFFQQNPRDRVMLHLREVLAGGARGSQDVRVVRGAFRRINWALRGREGKGEP